MSGAEHLLAGSLEALPPEHPYPGVSRRSFNSPKATVAAYDFDPQAEFPRHRHPEEQITIVTEGEIDFFSGERRQPMRTGDWCVVTGGLEHSLHAGPEGAAILAILVPRREGSSSYTVLGS